MLIGFAGTVLAFVPHLSSRIPVTEVVNSTSYTKNDDGTFNKIEDITRTTVVDPQAVQNQIDNLTTQLNSLQSVKATLSTQVNSAPMSKVN